MPFILSGLGISFFSGLLRRVNKYARIISIISGAFLIAMGVIFITNSMIRIIGYLL
ncbi:MAG: hypothetical protein H5T85_08000 [Actinobacteria bacterium]|nr:hypothetical protein [Actinomycetota bacterium]